ncbi:serine hydrolase [Streptomyces sp. NPDC090025]|uniref:serine hydrolase n=1 Tax=Streptomyces sp. NPDC090025 TaxID=3365922 RepID=UPI00383420F3
MKARSALALLSPLGVALVIAVCAWLVLYQAGGSTGRSPRPAPPPAPTPGTLAATASAAPAPADAAGRRRAARTALEAIDAHGGRYVIAVEDLTSGESVVHGETQGRFVSASVIKADILAALLLRAQDEGVVLTAEQRDLAAAMIRRSDNDAAQRLWVEIGRREGFDAANGRLGLSPEHAGQRGVWGLTRTTVQDQLTLLRRIFTEESPLTAESRTYLRTLMSTVADDQRWGIAAAASPEGAVALKNGWLPREPTGLWVVNSIGMVEREGHTLLVAVLTDGQSTRDAGIDLVEHAATAAADALAAR